MNNYQQAINRAALVLCQEDDSLLLNRDKLFKNSQNKVKEDGYEFVKGKSRAKEGEEQKKRVKSTKDDRSEYTTLLHQDILAKEEQIRYKEQRLGIAKNSNSWDLCDKFTGEISKLRKEAFQLKQELKLIQCKQSQSLWYEKQKTHSKQRKSKGKESEEVICNEGSDKESSIDAKGNNTTTSTATLPSLFNRLREQGNPPAQSVPEISSVEQAGSSSVQECSRKAPPSEFVSAKITSAKEGANGQGSECGEKDVDSHFL